MKPTNCTRRPKFHPQPPSGGCVLKRGGRGSCNTSGSQPPSGGCVLKHLPYGGRLKLVRPAAFGRLCVETVINPYKISEYGQPPSGGCVLKHPRVKRISMKPVQPPSGGCVLKLGNKICLLVAQCQPPSGGCVLKPLSQSDPICATKASRLRAAVC